MRCIRNVVRWVQKGRSQCSVETKGTRGSSGSEEKPYLDRNLREQTLERVGDRLIHQVVRPLLVCDSLEVLKLVRADLRPFEVNLPAELRVDGPCLNRGIYGELVRGG